MIGSFAQTASRALSQGPTRHAEACRCHGCMAPFHYTYGYTCRPCPLCTQPGSSAGDPRSKFLSFFCLSFLWIASLHRSKSRLLRRPKSCCRRLPLSIPPPPKKSPFLHACSLPWTGRSLFIMGSLFLGPSPRHVVGRGRNTTGTNATNSLRLSLFLRGFFLVVATVIKIATRFCHLSFLGGPQHHITSHPLS